MVKNISYNMFRWIHTSTNIIMKNAMFKKMIIIICFLVNVTAFCQPISIEHVISLYDSTIDFDRAQMNLDNSWLAVENIQDEPMVIYFFN